MTHPAQATYDAKRAAHMQAFLLAFPRLGTVSEAATAAQVHPDTVSRWIRDDVDGFATRYREAQLEWAEYLEGIARKRIEEPSNNGRTGSDVLLIAMLNANHPEKWRRDTVVVGSDSTRQLLEAIAKLAARQQPQVVEGTATVKDQVAKMLGPGDGKAPPLSASGDEKASQEEKP